MNRRASLCHNKWPTYTPHKQNTKKKETYFLGISFTQLNHRQRKRVFCTIVHTLKSFGFHLLLSFFCLDNEKVSHVLNSGQTAKKVNVKWTKEWAKSVSPEILIGLRYVVNQCVSDYQVQRAHTHTHSWKFRRLKETSRRHISLLSVAQKVVIEKAKR